MQIFLPEYLFLSVDANFNPFSLQTTSWLRWKLRIRSAKIITLETSGNFVARLLIIQVIMIKAVLVRCVKLLVTVKCLVKSPVDRLLFILSASILLFLKCLALIRRHSTSHVRSYNSQFSDCISHYFKNWVN